MVLSQIVFMAPGVSPSARAVGCSVKDRRGPRVDSWVLSLDFFLFSCQQIPAASALRFFHLYLWRGGKRWYYREPFLIKEFEFYLVGQKFSTVVPQEILKCAVSNYLDRALTFFPLDCQIKNDNSAHNNSCLLWMNQNYTYFFVRSAKNLFFGVLQNFSN